MSYSPYKKEIQIGLPELLAFREKTLGELFCEDSGGDECKLYLPYAGLTLMAAIEKSSPEWTQISGTVNQPFFFQDVRFVGHDFSSTLWGEDSTYTIAPDAGQRVILTDIFIRFSKAAYIGDNKPVIRVWKWFGALVCVKEVVFQNVRDLINQSESVTVLTGLFNDDVVELKYRYADACTFEGAPIVLKGGAGEYMEIFLENHQPIRNVSGGVLPDACTVSFIGKMGGDF